ASRSGTLDIQLHFLDSQLLGGFDRLFSGETRRERRTLAGALEAGRTGTPPGDGVAVHVGNGHNGIVEGCKDMHLSGGQGALALLCTGGAARGTYTLSHILSSLLFLGTAAASATGNGLLDALACA